MAAIPESSRLNFYDAALLGLRLLDQRERTARRFGDDATARWHSFEGHLDASEHLDLLIRDAAVAWHVAFSPAQIFFLPGLASDEPFGPDWSSLTAQEARSLLARTTGDVSLADIAAALHIDTSSSVALPETITLTTKLLVSGGQAVYAVAQRFASNRDLSWSDQVIVVDDDPATRQLAGLVAPWLDARAATVIALPDADDVDAKLKSSGFSAGFRIVQSPDASTDVRIFLAQLGPR